MTDQDALRLIQEDRPLDFNRLIQAREGVVDLVGAQFRGYDLRKFDLRRANLADCYMRNADLRGLDLGGANLEGASIKDAKVSGTFFPANIAPEEIRLSLEQGTRLRVRR